MFGENLSRVLNRLTPSVIMSEYMQEETPVIDYFKNINQSYSLENHNFTLAILLANMTNFKALEASKNIFDFNIQ